MNTFDEARHLLEPSNRLQHAWALDWSTLPAGVARELLVRQADRVFTTSGTSGPPQAWRRTGEQLALELEVTADILAGDADVVHATVKPTSLYGYVGTFLGAYLGIPTVFDEWGTAGTPLMGRRPLVFTIPVSWRRLAPTLAAMPLDGIIVVHAGSMLPSRVLSIISDLGLGDRAELFDLFGATETGVIGSRLVLPAGEIEWTVTNDTHLSFPAADDNGEARPIVSSPRVGRPEGQPNPGNVVLGDWLLPTGVASFGFKGRRERIVKPGGKVVDLDELEGQISALVPAIDIACVPIEHREFGEHVEILVAGPPNLASQVLELLRTRSASLSFVPESARPVDHIPRSPMGKVRRVQPQIYKESAA